MMVGQVCVGRRQPHMVSDRDRTCNGHFRRMWSAGDFLTESAQRK